MGRFFERILAAFLLALVFAMALALLFMLDFTGFYVIHEKFPESLKKNATVANYIKWAKINSLAPKDQKTVMLEERKIFVEKLLSRMKIESKRILEEKEKLELSFRKLEEKEKSFKQKVDLFEQKKAKEESLKAEVNKEDLVKRLENLSTMYAKMDPARAAQVLLESKNKSENIEVLKRLKPKSLGLILENMPPREAYDYVSELQK